jgi:hypothetical protein
VAVALDALHLTALIQWPVPRHVAEASAASGIGQYIGDTGGGEGRYRCSGIYRATAPFDIEC